jgi:hypothetical protein
MHDRRLACRKEIAADLKSQWGKPPMCRRRLVMVFFLAASFAIAAIAADRKDVPVPCEAYQCTCGNAA